MANQEQLSILKQGVETWNRWREENPDLTRAIVWDELRNELGIDLRDADLRDLDLPHVNLSEVNLTGAHLDGSNLFRADLRVTILTNATLCKTTIGDAKLHGARLENADLRGADLVGARFSGANLRGADLRDAWLWGANFLRADLTEANLCGAFLEEANFLRTKVDQAKISHSRIYGVNAWSLEGDFAEQKSLIITPKDESRLSVDNFKVAQFIYLVLNNREIRDAINTLTSKSVLILGRFAPPERKKILDALKNKLRGYDLLPIVFDFERPTDKDFTETIQTLAGLSYFVIADITNPRSSPLELQATVPDYQIPFVPIVQEGEKPFAMMVDLQKKYNWVLNTVSYDSQETLMNVLKPLIIDPAMKKRQELRLIKAQEPEIISAKEYLEKNEK